MMMIIIIIIILIIIIIKNFHNLHTIEIKSRSFKDFDSLTLSCL